MFDKHRLTADWSAVPIAATLLLLTLSVHTQARAQEIELRSYPLPSQQQRHTMEIRQTITGTLTAAEGADEKTKAALQARQGAIGQGLKMQTEMVSLLRTGAEDAQGNYSLQSKYAQARTSILDAKGSSREVASPLLNLEIQAVLNQARGDIADVRILNGELDPKLLAAVSKSIAGVVHSLQGLEGKTLRIGESVEAPFAIDLPMPVPGTGTQMKTTMRSTLVALEDGVATIDSVIELTFELDGKLQSAAVPLKARGSGQGSGSMKWRLSDRLVMRSQQAMQMQFEITMPDGSTMLMQQQMEMQSRGENLAAR